MLYLEGLFGTGKHLVEVVFKVEHHGMFIEEPIRFSPGINILCGKNGSGKTRLIDAIRKQNITSVSNENGIVNSKSSCIK